MLETIKNKNTIAIMLCIAIVIGIGGYIYWNGNNSKEDTIEALEAAEGTAEEGAGKEQENGKKKEEENTIVKTNNEKIAIHVTGEVKKKGIVYLKQGARIIDAIKQAGGATKNANLDQVNLAYVLEDGQKIYIPNKKEKIDANAYISANSGNNVIVEGGKNSNFGDGSAINSNVANTKTNSNSNSATNNKNTKGANGKVNINSANQTELETLPGIGPALAQRIIEHRKSNGSFNKIEDIQEVKGIGNSKYSNIKEYICI